MIEGDLLLILLALPFAGSLVAAASPANVRHAEAWLSGAVAVAGLGIAAALYPAVADGGAVRARLEWLPAYGLDVSLRLDGFAWIFAASSWASASSSSSTPATTSRPTIRRRASTAGSSPSWGR